jgi:hypothetical protein
MTTVFLCTGDDVLGGPFGQTCWNCGGWVHAGDPPEVPEGEEPIGGHYCSVECHDEALRFAERARKAFVSDWCPQCGYDRHEHGPGCPKLALMHPVALHAK